MGLLASVCIFLAVDVVELAADVLAVAGDAGFRVSEAQLARWHRAGLLPRPRQTSLGRGKGTATLYPPGTTAQLLALCRIRRSERSLARVGFRLWWDGYPVDPDLVTEPLLESAAALDAVLGLGPPTRQSAPTPAERLLAKRLGRQRVARLNDEARTALQAGPADGVIDWDTFTEEPPNLDDLPRVMVSVAVNALAGRTVSDIVRATSLDEWADARNKAKGLLRILQEWAAPLAWLLGKKQGAALKAVSEMSARLDTQDLQHLLVGQVIVGPVLPPELLAALNTPPPTPPLIEQLTAVMGVNDRVPGAEEVFTPAALRALQRGKEAGTRSLAKMGRFVQENHDLVEKAIADTRSGMAPPADGPADDSGPRA